MAENRYQSNEIIFKTGDESNYAYLILEGNVEILRDFPQNPIRLGLLEKGDIFGEMGLVDERPRSLTARATNETKVQMITREEFVDLIRHHPDQALVYLKMFFERLRAMNMRVPQDVSDTPIKQEVKKSVFIFPTTPMSAVYVSKTGHQINSKSYRVGRSSSGSDPLEVNDLSLQDNSPYNVSRNHFSVERIDNKVFIQDRGSFLGTIVNGKIIGGHHHTGIIELREGENDVIAGSHHSPYKFKVIVKSEE